MPYKIQHLKLRGILDQAISIVKDHFGLLFSIMLFALIPFQLVAGFIELAISPELPANPTMEDILAAQRSTSQYWPIYGMLALIGNFLILPVTNASVIHAVARIYLGQKTTALEAIRFGLSRLLPLIGTSMLMGLAIMGGFILLIIPGILFALWFGLAQHVVVLEGLSGTTALGRSKTIVRPHIGTFLLLIIVMVVISVALGLASGLIPNSVLSVFGRVFVSAIATILWTAAGVVFYFSCRCDVENFDLHYLAESIGGGVPEPGDAGDSRRPAI